MSKLKIYCQDSEYIELDKLSLVVQKVLKQRINLYIDLSFVSQDEIRLLNKENRAIDRVTDVLSFPMLDGIRGKVIRKKDFLLDYDEDEKAIFLGSIAVCFDKAKEQAKEYGHDLERELYYLVVHGCLHLFGYDHVTDELKQEMRTLEEKILTELGVLR